MAKLIIHTAACPPHTTLPLFAFLPHAAEARYSGHQLESLPLPLPVGTELSSDSANALADTNGPLFRVVGHSTLPGQSRPCPWLQALRPVPALRHTFTSSRQGYAVACITLSDKGWIGEREDRSGPALLDLARSTLSVCHSSLFLLPDSPSALQALALELAYSHGYDLILTCGGTGLSPRDLTPEALLPLLSRRLPGLEHVMMATSLTKTPHAALSRAIAGTLDRSLIIALPGSLRGATENLTAALAALPHALAKLAGDHADCGG